LWGERPSVVARPQPDWFGRFVALLGRPDVSIRSIHFVGFAFDGGGATAGGVRALDLERLLGSVLPVHPTLERIRFVRCAMSDAPWGLFVRSLRTTTARTGCVPPHKHLIVEGRLLDLALVQPLAEMVCRNVRLSGLALNSRAGMDPEVCRLLCGGLSRNTHLHDLSIDVTDVFPGAVDGATGPASPVRSLSIGGRFVPSSVVHLANQLKTNSRLTSLTLSSRREDAHGSSSPHLAARRRRRGADERYTFRIRHVSEQAMFWPDLDGGSIDGAARIVTYVRRNHWIQNALAHMVNYRVPSSHLWPILLGRVSEVPTLLYRFLRRGNLEALCAVVAVRRNPKHHNNAGRII
jgi:hypothetical protein